MPPSDQATQVVEWCRQLAECTEQAGAITRTFLSPPMHDVHERLSRWMSGLGMDARVDAAGNLRGLYDAAPGGSARRLLIASHLDSVPQAGAFDGVLGVVLAIALVERLRGKRLPYAIEVIGFSDEEGTRFGAPFIGSRALAGTLDSALLERRDAGGKSVREAIADFGLDPARLDEAKMAAGSIAYLECHIEQGPVLDRMNAPVAIVTAIAGQSRAQLTFTGAANHAGTTPMNGRRDALAGAAEWIVAVEHEGRETPDLVATVGRIDAEPGAANVIPGSCRVTLDLRHRDDRIRHAAYGRLVNVARGIAARRGLDVRVEPRLDQAAVPLDETMTARLVRATEAAGQPVHCMTSGAGHDAMVMAGIVPVGMLFVRSPGGISHHPDETVRAEDVEVALQIGLQFLEELSVIDLAIRGGTVVTADVSLRADIGIDGESIVAVGGSVGSSRNEIDATGLTIFPGVVDAHLHFNEPGRTEWEGAATGSRALAAGGGTVFFDMPLNSTPCTIGVADFDRKVAALEAASITDFALWGGLVPGRIGDLAGMDARGVVGFKAFMSDSGLPEFPRADDETLLTGMREAARLGAIVAVHAESEEITKGLAQKPGAGDARAFLASRPVVAEIDAIQRALLFAEETGAALHIVHVSSGRGVALAYAAKARGVNVSIETCPHYLFFTEDDLETLGTIGKCAPPLRSAGEQQRLWSELALGHVDLVASDHSPTEPALKARPFSEAWGGIAGVQSTLAVLLERGHHERQLPLDRIARLLAWAPAQRFGIARKGALAPGFDADLALVDLHAPFTLAADRLLQRHKTSPYAGHVFRGSVRRTLRRGETIFIDGQITASTRGRLLTPSASGAQHV